MNFVKGVASICHSFRSTGQPGRINGFDRCFQVVELCTARRDRVTPVLVKTQILKFYQPHMGKQRPFMGITEPRLGIIEPHWGIIVSGRRGGLMVSALVSGLSGPGSSPGRRHCVVFLGKTLYSHSAPLHPGV